MKKILSLLLLLLGQQAISQTVISGVVKDNKGETLPGVNITLVGSYDGATSNGKGEYSFETDAKDSITLRASYTGYANHIVQTLVQGKEMKVDFILKEKITEMKAVVISAGAFEASDEKKGTVLKALDIVTTAGSNGDSYSALKTLPGAQQVNDREGLFVRGGTGSETQTFIDGTWVKNAFSASVPDLGARGRFNPFIFKGTVFSTGGYSALYGQALSSAVILESIDLPEKSAASLFLSTVGVGGNYQKLSKNKLSSYGIGYNYTNLAPYFALIKQNIQYKKAPEVHQIDLNFRKKTSKTGMIKFYGYLNHTTIDINRNNINSLDYTDANKVYQDRFSIQNTNLYGNLSYKEFFKKNWRVVAGACAAYNRDQILTQVLNHGNINYSDSNFSYTANQRIENYTEMASGKIYLERSLPNLNMIRFGTEYIYSADQTDYNNLYTAFHGKYKTREHYKAVFAESDIYITNDLAGKIGVRGEHSALLNAYNVAPRASMAYKIRRRGQISLAYGMFFQKPEQTYLFKNQDLNYMRANHYILNYQYQPKDRLLRLEGYYKAYHNLIKTNITGAPQGIATNGTGYARGIEIFYRDKKTLKGIDFWISYSYLDTKRDFINYPKMVQPDFAARHTGNLVFKKFWPKRMFGINGTYTIASGRPYYNPNLSADLFMSERTKVFNNFSLSANYLKNIGKAFTVWVVSINNPFNFKQVYGYNFSQKDLNLDNRYSSQAVLPSARQFIFMGVFMSWGIDRTQEAIDNNL